MVYLHEIADPRYQALTGSLGYVSLGVGVVIGILVVICVTNIVPAGMLTLPCVFVAWCESFTLSVLTASAVYLLRLTPCCWFIYDSVYSVDPRVGQTIIRTLQTCQKLRVHLRHRNV